VCYAIAKDNRGLDLPFIQDFLANFAFIAYLGRGVESPSQKRCRKICLCGPVILVGMWVNIAFAVAETLSIAARVS